MRRLFDPFRSVKLDEGPTGFDSGVRCREIRSGGWRDGCLIAKRSNDPGLPITHGA